MEYIDGLDQQRKDLEKSIETSNIAKGLDADVLAQIGKKVVEEFDIDERSRDAWRDRSETAMKLATHMIDNFDPDEKDFNDVNYPLLLTAAISFSARAYTQLVQFGNIVKGKVVGADEGNAKADKAKRIQSHMNYQLSEQMEEWADDTDSLLTALPIEGCEFKKTYFNSLDKVNVSEWIRPIDLVVNYKARSIEKAARYTHVLKVYPNNIIERINSGLYLDIPDIKEPAGYTGDEDEQNPSIDDDAPHIFYEQHRYWDLDGDGYKEPYIVTVHKETEKVVRIVARFDIDGVEFNKQGKLIRIKPVHYITRFIFMPSPDGGVYGMGYGNIIGPINLATNMVLNEILMAGFLANTQGGFVGKGTSLKKGRGGGDIEFQHGDFQQVNHTGDDIRKSILALPFKGPEPALFQVMDRIINSGEKLGSITDPLVGESPGADVPATTILALIEQGSKIPSAVYARLHKAFKSEYKKIFRLNSLYLEDKEYFNINDEQESVAQDDYDYKSCDVVPVSNPAEISNTHKLLMGQALMQFYGKGLNDTEIIKANLEALQITDVDRFLPKEGAKQPPDPKIMLEVQKLDLERDKLNLEIFKAKFEVLETHAKAIEHMAKAEGVEPGQQIQLYTAQLQSIQKEQEMMLKQKESQNATSQQGGAG